LEIFKDLLMVTQILNPDLSGGKTRLSLLSCYLLGKGCHGRKGALENSDFRAESICLHEI
jgi:hypothetical protein